MGTNRVALGLMSHRTNDRSPDCRVGMPPANRHWICLEAVRMRSQGNMIRLCKFRQRYAIFLCLFVSELARDSRKRIGKEESQSARCLAVAVGANRILFSRTFVTVRAWFFALSRRETRHTVHASPPVGVNDDFLGCGFLFGCHGDRIAVFVFWKIFYVQDRIFQRRCGELCDWSKLIPPKTSNGDLLLVPTNDQVNHR